MTTDTMKGLFVPVGTEEANIACPACAEREGAPATHTRRAMLGAVALGILGVTAACGQESAEQGGNEAAQAVTIARADVPAVGGEPFKASEGNFYLVHNADGLLALSRTCTHMGCTVPWKQGEDCFHCPCHGSKFDRNGVRFAGPAKRPLALAKLAVQTSGDIVVSPHEQTDRQEYEPSQAVPWPAKGA
jgi:cytochrome b6-f complex iron-sulfur subunit